MPTKRPRKAVRPDDKRLKANRPAPAVVKPKTRIQQLIDGDITVDDLDDEEIQRGRCRSADGTFSGRPRGMLPRALVDSLRSEFQKRSAEKWEEMGDVARRVLLEVATNKRANPEARVRAALAIAERAEGKVSDKIVATVELKPFEQDLAGLMVDVEGPDIVQGTVVPINRKQEAS